MNAVVEVDAGLPVGSYRFQLVVEGESGLKSSPTEFIVVVTPIRETPRSPLNLELTAPAPGRPRSVRPVSQSSDTSAVARRPAKRQPPKRQPVKRKAPKQKPTTRKPAKPKPTTRKPAKDKPTKRRPKPRTPPPS